MRWRTAAGRSHRQQLPPGEYTIGRDPACQVVVDDPSVSTRHARVEVTANDCLFLDEESTNGLWWEGQAVSSARLEEAGMVRLGSCELWVRPVRSWREIYEEKKFSLISIIFHALLLLLVARWTLFPAIERISDFAATEASSGFLAEPAPSGEPPGGEAAAGPAQDRPDFAPSLPDLSSATIAAITTTAVSPLSLPAPPAVSASMLTAPPTLGGLSGRGGGGTSYRSAGLGTGSGLGQGVSQWIGGGAGELGISGRGKSLRTVNEFSVYFVIHSGDWFAALDTMMAPQPRNTEAVPEGLPDSENIRWGTFEPNPRQGPFVNYFWGGNWRKSDEDNRTRLLQFTPGAMSNLLRFVRMASADNIKGASKPRAVVLDPDLVPYRHDPARQTLQWNPENRERLREVLRSGLPALTSFYGGGFGYLWNPQPDDPAHPDFTVEYLLDVRPMPPFIYFTGNDDFELTEVEVDTLYQYILRGGAIWGDSGFAGHGSKFDTAFRREMKRVIPDIDKNFRPLNRENDLFIAGPDAYFDSENGFTRLPHGMQYYDSPIEVIEVMPGVVSVVLTKNAYGNFLRFETAVVNNRFQVGGELGRGLWAQQMWNFREEFFRGLDEEAIIDSYKLGTNILVYMLGRWPAVLNRPENRHLLQ
jgi:hypothetical protein